MLDEVDKAFRESDNMAESLEDESQRTVQYLYRGCWGTRVGQQKRSFQWKWFSYYEITATTTWQGWNYTMDIMDVKGERHQDKTSHMKNGARQTAWNVHWSVLLYASCMNVTLGKKVSSVPSVLSAVPYGFNIIFYQRKYKKMTVSK